jgi:hypothetical protein
MTALRILADRSGTAAAEMAIILPLLLVLLYGGVEAGHFIWTQHKLTEAVRSGSRFAGRLQEVAMACDPDGAAADIDEATRGRIKLFTRTGQQDDPDAAPFIPHWTDAQVQVSVACAFTDQGIYRQLGGNGPVVTVRASGVAYPSLFSSLGILDPQIRMTAEAHAPGTGL